MRRFNPHTITHAEFYRGMFGRGAVTPAMRDAADDAASGSFRAASRRDLQDAGIPFDDAPAAGGFDADGNLLG